MKWKPNTLGRDGDVEATIEIANPVEPEFPIKIRASVYQPSEPKERCFGKVVLDIGTKTELLRVYHKDFERAKMMVEEGLTNMVQALANGVKASS